MCQEQNARIAALEEENRALHQLLRETCERFFRYVPLSCRLNADILDDWFRFAKEVESHGWFLPEKKDTHENKS